MNTKTQVEIDKLVNEMELLPHPEGGFYKEVYRSTGIISSKALSGDYSGDRNFCTSIYFLLTSENFSAFHRIKQDEVWHFYSGSPLIVHVIDPEGKYSANRIGFDPENKTFPQFTVPGGSWFASSVESEDGYSLVGCTVAPGFDFNDFELANRTDLIKEYPQHQTIISSLTRQ